MSTTMPLDMSGKTDLNQHNIKAVYDAGFRNSLNGSSHNNEDSTSRDTNSNTENASDDEPDFEAPSYSLKGSSHNNKDNHGKYSNAEDVNDDGQDIQDPDDDSPLKTSPIEDQCSADQHRYDKDNHDHNDECYSNMDAEDDLNDQATKQENKEITKPMLTSHDRDTEEEKPGISHTEPPDGGYGWVVTIASLCVLMVFGANWIMFSIYITEFVEVFDKPQAYIGIIGSLDAALCQMFALPSGALASVYGSRPVCIVGLLIFVLGTFLSAFATNFYVLLFTFGILKGAGAGMTFVPASMIVQQYFNKHRAVAAGISSCGLSLGTMIFGPILRLLIQTFGWRGALIMMSGIILQAVICAALFRPVPESQRTKSIQKSKSPESQASNSVKMILKHLHKSLAVSSFKDPKFPLFVTMKMLSTFGILAMYKFSVARAIYYGIDELSASSLVTAIGITSTVFRNVGGAIANQPNVNRMLMYSVCSASGGIVVILSIIPTTQFPGHMTVLLCYGIFLGLSECLVATVSVDLFSVEKLGATLGWSMAFNGLITLVCMPFFGLLFDLTGSYNLAYIIGGCVQCLAGVNGLIVIILKRKERNRARHRATLKEEVSLDHPKPLPRYLRGNEFGSVDGINVSIIGLNEITK